MELRLDIEGATPEEIARGIKAAQAVFDDAGITAEEAAHGMFALEGWDIKGFPEGEKPSEQEQKAADAWLEANRAACDACCSGWPEDKVCRHLVLELVGVPRSKVEVANPANWPERRRLFGDLIERLETATGPDRQIDIDIAFALGWVDERGTPEQAAELDLPYLTSNLAQVAAIAHKSLADWTIEIDQESCDARVINPRRGDDILDDYLSMAAWRDFDGSLHMEKPPVNTAIALTLAIMRGQAAHFE
ncbi:hypothetical protein [Mesorhizobium sp.]|uniref:hypothetical protein n=1 Tax=Mesorhizobium sp. TaxID=1871066 RepID=UPI000FE5EC6C|nr:hypothetical protein [Mesorhizobium sp.]RWE77598.1 MAG: hypothetical protein EOS42_07690 [Mesorhizobium sp.]TIV32369.1 MAG: hypothetical protein E5V90_03390 [Mesorhizobium sp.]